MAAILIDPIEVLTLIAERKAGFQAEIDKNGCFVSRIKRNELVMIEDQINQAIENAKPYARRLENFENQCG